MEQSCIRARRKRGKVRWKRISNNGHNTRMWDNANQSPIQSIGTIGNINVYKFTMARVANGSCLSQYLQRITLASDDLVCLHMRFLEILVLLALGHFESWISYSIPDSQQGLCMPNGSSGCALIHTVCVANQTGNFNTEARSFAGLRLAKIRIAKCA